jgi:hypothetical protein
MRTRILLVVALAVSLVVVPAATGQSGKKTRTLNATIHAAVIKQEAGNVFAGELTGRPTGRAGIVIRAAPDGEEIVGRAVLYAKRGTIRATTRNVIQPQPDGSLRFVGTFKITGGTRAYRGATGSGTFEGTLPANSTYYTFDLDGKIRY